MHLVAQGVGPAAVAVDRARDVHAEGEPAVDVSAETPKRDEEHPAMETPWPSRAGGAVTLAESLLAGHPVSGTGGERCQVMVHAAG